MAFAARFGSSTTASTAPATAIPADFFGFIRTDLEQVLDRWREHRAATRRELSRPARR